VVPVVVVVAAIGFNGAGGNGEVEGGTVCFDRGGTGGGGRSCFVSFFLSSYSAA
jgi:hypothetical protein